MAPDNDTFKPLATLLGSPETMTPAGPSSPSSSPEDEPYDLHEVPDSEDEYRCKTCRDGRYVRRALPLGHPDFGKPVVCPDCRDRPVAKGVPDRLMNATFATFDLSYNRGMKPARDACRALAKGERWTVSLVGPPGVGKSHLAAAALQQSPSAGHFWEVGDLLRQLRHEAFGELGPHTPEVYALARWQDYEPLLVLDDMGAEKWTDWAAQTLYAILNARYQRRLPTLITSNVPDVMDERLVSRYAEGVVVCQGVDVRRAKR